MKIPDVVSRQKAGMGTVCRGLMEASPGGIFGCIAWYLLEKCQDEDHEDILHAI